MPVYKWKKYSINIPNLSWGTLEGDIPLQQSHMPGNNIAAVAFKNFSMIEKRFGSIYSGGTTFDELWFWMSDSNVNNSHTFISNERVSCASYPYVLIPEFAVVNGLVGWCIGYSTSGYWKTETAVNNVYHISSSSSYSNYQDCFCPNKSACTKGSFIGDVTGTYQSEYPTNGIGHSGNRFEESSSYWYVYDGTEPSKYTVSLSVVPANAGSVSGAGLYEENTTAKVTATPAAGYEFGNWQSSGTVFSTNNPYSFKVTGSRELTAVFNKARYRITATVSPSGSGTVTGTGTFESGASVTLTATPKTGYEFVRWEKDDGSYVNTRPTLTLTVSTNENFIAVFKEESALWFGVNNTARKVGEIYIGVNGKARRVIEGYIGINGKARKFM